MGEAVAQLARIDLDGKLAESELQRVLELARSDVDWGRAENFHAVGLFLSGHDGRERGWPLLVRAFELGDVAAAWGLAYYAKQDDRVSEAVDWYSQILEASQPPASLSRVGQNLDFEALVKGALAELARIELQGTVPDPVAAESYLLRTNDEKLLFNVLFGQSLSKIRREKDPAAREAALLGCGTESGVRFALARLRWSEETTARHVRDIAPERKSSLREQFVQAVRSGHTEAAFWVGETLRTGTEAERREAANWYRVAWRAKSAAAARRLGSMLRRGDGIARDPQAAVLWYLRATSVAPPSGVHQVTAAYELSQMFRDGDGIDVDIERAQAYERLATLGYWLVEPLMRVAESHDTEFGSTGEDDLAAYWYLKVWRGAGDYRAARRLAAMYESGRGVDVDAARAAVLRSASLDEDSATR